MRSPQVPFLQAVRPSRAAVVVRAQAQDTSSRRSILGLVAAGTFSNVPGSADEAVQQQ